MGLTERQTRTLKCDAVYPYTWPSALIKNQASIKEIRILEIGLGIMKGAEKEVEKLV